MRLETDMLVLLVSRDTDQDDDETYIHIKICVIYPIRSVILRPSLAKQAIRWD